MRCLHKALGALCASLSPAILALSACGGAGGSATGAPSVAPSAAGPAPQSCAASGTPAPTPTPAGPSPQPAPGLTVPAGFTIDIIGRVNGARELAAAPNGDLFVGTNGSSIYLIRNAEGQAANPAVFAGMGDSPAAGVALSVSPPNCALYVGTQFGVYRIPYVIGDTTARATPQKIAEVRPGGSSDHSTTSVAIANGALYASVGSSCNACAETDPTRATIQQFRLDGTGAGAKAVHIRNAIALAVNPATQTLWTGDAGQDDLPFGHPYEFFDAVTLHTGTANYGWPDCEENHHAYTLGANCTSVVIPLVALPAYETPIGAVFYPTNQTGPYAFTSHYRGGAFIAMHGSWHTGSGGAYAAAPLVAFVAMTGDTPQTPVNWSDPAAQWTAFVSGFQTPDGTTRIGRPTGLAVGPSGSLFVADDQTGNIYRIRP